MYLHTLAHGHAHVQEHLSISLTFVLTTYCELAGMAQLVECWALGSQVLGSNLPQAVLEVTLGSHSSSSLTIPRCKIVTRPRSGNSELTLRIIMHKQEQSSGDDGYTLALKPMGRVNQSLKQQVPVAPQNGDLSPQKKLILHIFGRFLRHRW